MPNWCLNSLDITGPDADLDALLAQASPVSDAPDNTSRLNDAFSLNQLVPMPGSLLENGGWYDWRIEHWGTKWDLHEVTLTRKPAQANLTFLSAWDPPLAALETISKDYPSLRFRIYYEDEGGYFEGTVLLQGGQCLEEGFEKHPEGRMIEETSVEKSLPS